MKTEVRLCHSPAQNTLGDPHFPQRKSQNSWSSLFASQTTSYSLLLSSCLAVPWAWQLHCDLRALALAISSVRNTSSKTSMWLTHSPPSRLFFNFIFLMNTFSLLPWYTLSLLLCFILFHSAYHLQIFSYCAELVVCLPRLQCKFLEGKSFVFSLMKSKCLE